jgi:hypothetical protein
MSARCVAGALTLVVATSVHAQARTSSLSWVRLDGAETCLAGPDLARAVEARLGRDVFVATSSAEVAVEGRAERNANADAARWRAVLRMTDTGGELIGERVLESRAESCDELGRVAVIAIALMIDPVTPASPPRAPEPPPPASPVEAPRDRAPASRPWRFEADAALFGALGLAPGLALGGLGALIVEPPGFVPLVVEGALVPLARVDAAGVRADFLRVVGGAQVCPLALRGSRLALHGCVGFDVGALFVLDSSVPLREREKVLVQGHVALRGHWRVAGPLVVRLGLHLLVPFRAVSFARADGLDEQVYAPASVGGMLDLGAGLEF